MRYAGSMGQAKDNKYLKQRKGRNVWMFNMRLPKEIQHIYEGKSTLSKSLQTDSLSVARLRRDRLLAIISEQREQASFGGRATFLSYHQTLLEAKKEFGGNDPLSPYNQLDLATLLGTERNPELQKEASNAVSTGFVPVKYTATLKDALNDWISKNKGRNADTIIKMRGTVKRYLEHCRLNDAVLLMITRADVMSYIEETVQAYSLSTVKGNLSRLKTLFRHSWQVGLSEIKDNPFEDHILTHYKFEKGAKESVKKQLFDREQIKQLTQWADAQDDKAIRLLIWLGLFTGCRIGELCELKVSDVHIDGILMALYIRKGKTEAAQRTVPVPKRIHRLLKDRIDHLAPEDNLIGYRSKDASRKFSQYKTAHVTSDSSYSFHSFRAHVSTAYQRAGVNETTAAFIVGHKTGNTMTYGYYARADELVRLAEASELMAKVVERDWL
ncbi:integrase family protein [Glaciecola sp. 4H-3-7+YE-5]|jgi:integrase|nr:integrase family protein [Glaciecola sp. 4H-3-7+YE-5]